MFVPKICTVFATMLSKMLSTEVTAWMKGCSTITEAKRLVSLITSFNWSMDAVSWSVKCMLGLWWCWCWLLWGRWLIKVLIASFFLQLGYSYCQVHLQKCQMYTWKCRIHESRVCDWSIVMITIRYLQCAMAKAAVMLGSNFISWLWKSRTWWSLCSTYVYVATTKAGVEFSICWTRPLIIMIQDFI